MVSVVLSPALIIYQKLWYERLDGCNDPVLWGVNIKLKSISARVLFNLLFVLW